MSKRRQAGRRAAGRSERDVVGGPESLDDTPRESAPTPATAPVTPPESPAGPRRSVPIVIPSIAELAGYAALATTVAVVVMILNDRPRWQAAAVVAGAALVVVVLSFVASRARPERSHDDPDEPKSVRSGARRRRRP